MYVIKNWFFLFIYSYKLKNTKIDNQTDKIRELVGYTNYVFVVHVWEKYPIYNKFFPEPGIVRIEDLLDV